jgi:hypothetical protein
MATQAGLFHGNLVSGNTSRDPILSNYVFESGLHDPEWSKILTYKYPQYYLTTMMDSMVP